MVVTTLLTFPVLAQSKDTTTNELYGGGVYGRFFVSPGSNAFGWIASITQYPYESYHWIGGTIEGSGLFDSRDERAAGLTLNESSYTAMAGPSFSTSAGHGLRPFAHLLLGAVIQNTTITGPDAAVYEGDATSSRTVFGFVLGGGMDVRISEKLSARGQSDWLSFRENSNDRVDALRVSGGLVLKF